MTGTLELTPAPGLAAACRAMGLWRGALGRHKARAHRAAFVGPGLGAKAAAPTLLDANASSTERRHQRSHPIYAKPELMAIAPNQIWSWDITKLKGPAKWTCFHLYVILDIFSRHVVGWLIAPRESAELAQQLIADTVARHDVAPGALTLHADRSTSMRSKPVAALLVDVSKNHSRPYTSDDNPYSQSQFKTMKYRSDYLCLLWGNAVRSTLQVQFREPKCRFAGDFAVGIDPSTANVLCVIIPL